MRIEDQIRGRKEWSAWRRKRGQIVDEVEEEQREVQREGIGCDHPSSTPVEKSSINTLRPPPSLIQLNPTPPSFLLLLSSHSIPPDVADGRIKETKQNDEQSGKDGGASVAPDLNEDEKTFTFNSCH
jgi:hypothetical protein